MKSKKTEKSEIINLKGWKGKDSINISESEEYYEVHEHRKDKLSGEIAKSVHKIPKKNVENLFTLIKEHCSSIGFSVTYRQLVPSIIEFYHFPIEIEEFNGGRNRAKYYFPFYYYCAKILESKGFIRYGGRGKLLRLR